MPGTKTVVDCTTGEQTEVDMTAEEEQALAAMQAADATKKYSFAAAEDTERLRLVNERAQTDPAYAALAELALKGVAR